MASTPLQYHAPDVLADVQTTHRRPLLLWIGVPFVAAAAVVAVLTRQGVIRDPSEPRLWLWLYGSCAALGGLGVLTVLVWAFDRAPRVRFTSEGVTFRRLRPWSKIARVGGTLHDDGVEPHLTLKYGTDPWPTFMGDCPLHTDPRFTEAEFHAFMDRLEAASADFPHVWLDRVLEPPCRDESGITRRVSAELLRRSGQR